MDFGKFEVLSAWKTAQALLDGCGQSDGVAALSLKDGRAAPRSAVTAPLLARARRHLPVLVSRTREVDSSGALTAALPLIGAGPGLTPSWDDFLMGYLCGLRTSPLCDARRIRFLRTFGEAMVTAGRRSTAASQVWIARTVHGDGPPWICSALDAIGAGSAALSALHTERALHVGHTSGTDMMFGALLGSALWKGYSRECELVARLCGFPDARHDPAE